jgi:hypothetical protein
MASIPLDSEVTCYGYYSTVSGVKWLLVQVTYKNVKYTGFMCAKWLEKK